MDETIKGTDIPDTPSPCKIVKNSSTISRGYKRDFVGRSRAINPRSLYWERVNALTFKLCIKGRISHTPRSHGQWSAYETGYPVAWVMNVGWAAGGEAWLGRCRDKRGDWCLGPTTFDDARAQTKNYVLGLPVGGTADEWFLTNPIRELNEIQAALFRTRGAFCN
jgi:hypothetical protein